MNLALNLNLKIMIKLVDLSLKITVDNVWMFVEKVASNRAESVIVKIIPEKKDETKKAN